MEPTGMLKNEHRTIEKILEALYALGRSCELGHCVNKIVVQQAVDLLQSFIDFCHHGKEEKFLFPALVAKGVAKEGGPISVMLEEHVLARQHIAALKAVINNFQAGDPLTEKIIVREAGKYVRLIRGHIVKEEKILFPLVPNYLTLEERQSIALQIKQFETEVIGEANLKKYENMVSEFEKYFF